MGAAEDRILDAAEIVFANKGYLGGALNDVAVAAGYTRPGLLHYFHSKQALLLALLERRDARLHIWERFDHELSFSELLGTVQEAINELQGIRTLIQLGHILTAEATSPEHPAYEWVRTREQGLRDRIARSVRVSQECGEVDASWDPDVVALVTLGCFEGIESHWLLDETVDIGAGMAFLRTLLLASDA